jgi:Cu/Ag efflux pump CusA
VQIVVGHRDGIPIHIHDVADVVIGSELRTGAATENGTEVVLGTVFMLIGENSRTVSERVHAKMGESTRRFPRASSPRPSITAPTWSTRPSTRSRKISLRARCWSS